ncbi:hypothetical protein B0T19DRAFT_460074 [Cercophora scortea]|uniref:N-acetyltransferase domain-containing protein n=1 Tax=Cercophora scortea TaxID=314031 RepID=A0AAE0ILM1_9PEZI|nr:hypothetical protein B0T19DRAFT_460074 [Cercophora scortea]
MAEPPLPPGVRFAKPDDLVRIGMVSLASFIGTDCYDWLWVEPNTYPQDTLAAEINHWKEDMKNGEEIFLVIEDEYDPDENSKTSAVIDPSQTNWRAPQPGEKVIVGAMSFTPNTGSDRADNHAQAPDAVYLRLNPGPMFLALEWSHSFKLSRFLEENETRLGFANGFNLEMLVVHPAYHRRGHARTLVKWMQDLARIDQVTVYVAADGKADKFYARVGFQIMERHWVPGDEIVPLGFRINMMKWLP